MYAAARHVEIERVTIAGRTYAFDDVVRAMDGALYYEASSWAGYGASGQAIVDQYLELHARRHGEPFAMAEAAAA